jgi:hypothetical protein
MSLSKRERYIAIALLVVGALFALNYFVRSLYLDPRAQVENDLRDITSKTSDADFLMSRQPKLKKIWQEMQDGGLKVDSSQAESQTLAALLEWAQGAGVNLAALKPERSQTEGQFEVISFSVSGTGSVQQISKLLWALETATIPVRVNDMQMTPRREGTDDLSVRLSVSALCLPPERAKPQPVAMISGEQP